MHEDFSKAGTLWQTETTNFRYLGQLEPVLNGLESSMINGTDPHQHLNFMDEETFVNIKWRKDLLQTQIAASEKKKSFKGMPD